MAKNLTHICRNGNILDFSAEHIGYFKLEDLLVLIANEWRFANEIDWSVLQHSLAVGKAAEILYPGNTPLIQHAYFHDIQESIIRDVPTPFKEVVGKAWYDMEAMVQSKLYKALNISSKLGDEDNEMVHDIDKAMGYVEIVHHFGINNEMLSFENTPAPEILVVCTMAFMEVMSLGPMFDENDLLRYDIVDHFKQIVSSSVY